MESLEFIRPVTRCGLCEVVKYKVDTVELSTRSSLNVIPHIKLFKCRHKNGIVQTKKMALQTDQSWIFKMYFSTLKITVNALHA